MKLSTQQGIFAAGMLHACAGALLLAVMFAGKCQKDEEKYVFEMVPEAQPLQEEIVEVAKVEAPKPVKTVQPVAIAKKAEPKQISFKDFVKKQGKPKAPIVKKKPVTQKLKITRPVIKTDDIHQKLAQVGTIDKQLMKYLTDVRRKIDGAWEEPVSFEGYIRAMKVEFEVDKAGNLVDFSVRQSSGSNVFDSSVAQAFSKVGLIGKPADPSKRKFAISFSKKT